MEINLGCELIRSEINHNLYVCKHCNKVYHNNDLNKQIICPKLLDKYAMDPNYPQVRLTKISSIDENDIKQDIWWDSTYTAQIQTENSDQCTQEQIDQRMKICEGCEFYKENQCLKCGCSLNREKNYMNKLYSAKQNCPIGKWGAIV